MTMILETLRAHEFLFVLWCCAVVLCFQQYRHPHQEDQQ